MAHFILHVAYDYRDERWLLEEDGGQESVAFGHNQARRAFLAHLGRYEHTMNFGLEIVRWISTPDSPDQISDFLRRKMDDNDRLFLSKLNRGEHQGWLSQTTWDLINARL